jgi:hypothetical protein
MDVSTKGLVFEGRPDLGERAVLGQGVDPRLVTVVGPGVLFDGLGSLRNRELLFDGC